MVWLPGVPQARLPYGGSSLNPVACVMHRTIGRWGGDYAVLSAQRVPSVHFLVGQQRDQWVQFYSTETTTAHAAGANGYAVGIEFSGQNSDVEELTAWQIEAGGWIVRELNAAHGIPLLFLETGPRVSEFRGFLNHSNVATTPQYTHHDFITKASWDGMVGPPKPPPPTAMHGGQDMFLVTNADKKEDRWLVTAAGLVPIPANEYLNLAATGMPHDDAVGQWVIDLWGDKLGKP